MKVTSASVAIAALSALVNGRNIDLPEATGLSNFSSDGFSPKPTLAAVGVHELLRRDGGPFNPNPANADAQFSYVVAPDNTCGYIGGRIGAGYTCNSIATCIFAMASQTDRGYLGCCLIDSTTTTCGYRAGCINSADYNVSCTDDGCRADPSTTKCTESTLPFCNTITFSEGVRDYWCGNVEVTTAQLASTTYRGESDDRTFSLLTDLGTDKSVSSGTKTLPGPSITQGTSVSSASATSTGGGGGGDDGDHKKKTPVGAIVGGVVGGVAAIALVGLALFFILRKKKTKTDPNTNSVPPPYHPPAMQQQPGTGPGGYNAVPQNQQTYYDPKHPYPSPGSQYVQPNSGVTGGFFPVQGQSDPSHHPTSPTVTDPRMSVAATSPSPSYGGYNTPAVQQTPQHTGYQQQQQPPFQPQQEVIHEAPANNVDSHRGQMHELA